MIISQGELLQLGKDAGQSLAKIRGIVFGVDSRETILSKMIDDSKILRQF
nr:hypothetical protein [uncultured Cohaesibacter sp.]